MRQVGVVDYLRPELYARGRPSLISAMRFMFRQMASWWLIWTIGGGALWAQADPREGQWAHATSSLMPQADVVWGELENGFRYALLPHRAVSQAATLQLLVLSGSIDETEQERGLAHYIEHMCFRGNSEFSEKEMVQFFQELGIEYGSDVNAVTTFDYTAYSLDFRDASAELLGRGLRLFRSFADGVTFAPEAVDLERGVILSELRSRDSFMAKGSLAELQAIFNGLKFPHRAPGGSPNTVNALTSAQFRAFYQRCYRSDLMVLVASGDFEATELEALVRERFGSMERPATPKPVRDYGTLVPNAGLRPESFRIGDVGYVRATLSSARKVSPVVDSREKRFEAQREGFVQALLSERLQRGLFNTPGGSADSEILLGHQATVAGVTSNGKEWGTHLGALDQMIRSTYRWGFEASEIESLRKRQLRSAELMIEQIDQSDPHVLSQRLLDSIVEHEVFVGPKQEFQWIAEAVRELSPESLNATYRRIWDVDNLVIHLNGEFNPELKSLEIVQALQKSRNPELREVQLAVRKEHRFALQKWGEPTAAELVRDLPQLGAKLYKFGNGVHLNIVPSTHEPAIVRTVVRVGSGLLDMPGNKPALKEFGLQTLFASGTAHYLADDIRKIIGSQFLSFDFGVEDHDAFTFSGTTSREDLQALLGVVTEFLYQPKFGTFVHRSQRMQATISRASDTVGMQEGMRDLVDHLFKGDARFTNGTFVDYVGLSSLDVKNWLEAPLSKGFVEVTIVGDVNEADVLEAMRLTLSQLAPRAETKVPRFEPKPVKIAAPPGFKRIEFTGESHLSVVMGYWPVDGEVSVRDRAVLYLLAKILEIHVREEIRNNLGLAYSPSAEFEAYDGFPEFSMLSASIDCAQEESSRIARLLEQIAAKLSREGINEGEFIGARGILSSKIRRSWTENGFLLQRLERAQERPESVEELIALKDGMVDTITIAEVEKWAKKVLTRRNVRTAAIVPKQFVGIFQTE
jgi:zinc protease